MARKLKIAQSEQQSDLLIRTLEKRFDTLQALLQHTHEAQQDIHGAAHEAGMVAAQTQHEITKAAATAIMPPPIAGEPGQPLAPPGE